jgi:hypothetical protein
LIPVIRISLDMKKAPWRASSWQVIRQRCPCVIRRLSGPDDGTERSLSGPEEGTERSLNDGGGGGGGTEGRSLKGPDGGGGRSLSGDDGEDGDDSGPRCS